MAEQFVIEGGVPLSGDVVPEGNKNGALPIIAAALLTDEEVRREGGSGGPEIRAWQAAFAALATAGDYDATVEFYRAIPEWIVGMGVMHAAARRK